MNFALILSGGVGTRMKSSVPKQYVSVAGKPIVMHTMEIFDKIERFDRIVIVANEEWQREIASWCEEYSINTSICFALPGDTRQESILNGLAECMLYSVNDSDVVIIHDAVRPLVSEELINTCIDKAREYGGCMPVIHVNDTIYYSEDGMTVTRLLKRDQLYAGQAPEAFRLPAYYKMNKDRTKEELKTYRGTSEIAYQYGEAYGIKLFLTPGDESNYKLTTKEDLDRYRLSMEKTIDESICIGINRKT